jgi:hypothetical protein
MLPRPYTAAWPTYACPWSLVSLRNSRPAYSGNICGYTSIAFGLHCASINNVRAPSAAAADAERLNEYLVERDFQQQNAHVSCVLATAAHDRMLINNTCTEVVLMPNFVFRSVLTAGNIFYIYVIKKHKTRGYNAAKAKPKAGVGQAS